MYQQVKLEKKPEKIDNPFTRSLRLTTGTIPQAVSFPAWGIDPGVNFGLTVIEENKVFVFHGALMQTDQTGYYSLIAFQFLQSMIGRFMYQEKIRMVIEGAAYNAPFRQVELSEIRAGFYLGAALYNFAKVWIKPPATIRKGAFGNGKVQAGDEWPTLNHNAADSLAIALYAAQEERSM